VLLGPIGLPDQLAPSVAPGIGLPQGAFYGAPKQHPNEGEAGICPGLHRVSLNRKAPRCWHYAAHPILDWAATCAHDMLTVGMERRFNKRLSVAEEQQPRPAPARSPDLTNWSAIA